ncbi:MAG: hypothetical protein R3C01_15405 [Planctomycetaceae bacterium]
MTILPNAVAAEETGPVAAVEYGSITGRIILEGTAPTLSQLVADSATAPTNGVCIAGTIPNEKLIVGSGNGIRDVFIFMPRAPKGGKKLADLPAEEMQDVTMNNKNCTFLPHAMLVKTTQVLHIINSDGVPHNVKANTAAGKSQNATVSPNDTTGDVKFTYLVGETRPVQIECNFHAWMKAWHLPLSHPYGACSDADGNFTIKDLPVGSHNFVLFHEGVKILDQKITVAKEGNAPIEIRIPVGDLKVAHAQPKTFKRVVLSSIPGFVP